MKLILKTLALLSLALSVIACAQETESIPSLATQFVTAIDNRDLEAYASLFNDDAVFDDLGNVNTGLEEIRAFGQLLIDAEADYTIKSETLEGDVLTFTFDFINNGGYTLTDATGVITIADGRIQELIISRN
jgi:hypothetical protein